MHMHKMLWLQFGTQPSVTHVWSVPDRASRSSWLDHHPCSFLLLCSSLLCCKSSPQGKGRAGVYVLERGSRYRSEISCRWEICLRGSGDQQVWTGPHPWTASFQAIKPRTWTAQACRDWTDSFASRSVAIGRGRSRDLCRRSLGLLGLPRFTCSCFCFPQQ